MIRALENLSNNLNIKVKNEEDKNYNIVFSKDFGELVDNLSDFDIKNKRLCVITDSHVGPIYLDELTNILSPACKEVISFQFEAGESHKNLDMISNIYELLINNQFDRNDMLIALGGGVVGDMTGFAAATYLRGIDFVQIPTSLLAQVDSSIGGKTGVDFKSFKNMVGAFSMPKLVYMNISTLNSLPEREYLSGMGEIIKHGLIKDKEYFMWLSENKDLIINKDYETLREMIFVSCCIKGNVVENDPREKGERALLNFGHTIGHGIEKLKNFSLLHGECVALGVCAASYISLKKEYISLVDYNKIISVFEDFNLPVLTDGIDAKEVANTTLNDKKMDSGVIKFILIDKIGHGIIDKTISFNDIIDGANTVIRG